MSRVLKAWFGSNGKALLIKQGDITKEASKAIVNAANENLSHGGGVAGAIARKGGKVIEEESRNIIRAQKRVPTGEAAITNAGDLPSSKVIHAVGPIWRGGKEGEEGLLTSCVRKALELADENAVDSISIPAISSGIYGYPREAAVDVIFRTSLSFLRGETKALQQIRLLNIDDPTVNAFVARFEKEFGEEDEVIE